MAGQLWVTDTVGGFMSSRKLSKELRYAVQPTVKFRQFAEIKDAIGKNKGDLHTWNVYSDVATQGTVLVETNTMPETNFTITQGTMTLTEFGNSVKKLAALFSSFVDELCSVVIGSKVAFAA